MSRTSQAHAPHRHRCMHVPTPHLQILSARLGGRGTPAVLWAGAMGRGKCISKLPCAQTCANCVNMRKQCAKAFVFAQTCSKLLCLLKHAYAQTCSNMCKHGQTYNCVCSDDPIAKQKISSVRKHAQTRANLAQTSANTVQTIQNHWQTLHK
jgi:hypothetical protein